MRTSPKTKSLERLPEKENKSNDAIHNSHTADHKYSSGPTGWLYKQTIHGSVAAALTYNSVLSSAGAEAASDQDTAA